MSPHTLSGIADLATALGFFYVFAWMYRIERRIERDRNNDILATPRRRGRRK